MSGVANLSNSVINLAALREHARKELTQVLDSVPGGKGLVLDPKLSGPLGLIAEVSLLKEHGVEKIYHISERLDTECRSLIYLIRPKLHFMKYLADHIRAHQSAGQKKEYSIFFVPRRTMLAERHLEEEGIYDDVTIGEYRLDLITFDHDILSLELDDAYKECFLEGDRSSLFIVARSIMKLQSLFGIIPHIKAKGDCSKRVVEMLLRMRRELGADETNMITPEIDTLILIDRQTDMITPMCTPLTYEGLIDEIFLIQNTYVDLEPELLGLSEEALKKAKAEGKKIKTPLNSNDRLYSQFRDASIAALPGLLNKKAKEIDDYYKKRYDVFQSVSKMREFVNGLGSYQQDHQSLRLHTNVTEHILSVTNRRGFRQRLDAEQGMLVGNEEPAAYIEECINKRDSLLKVLRLLTMLSQCNGGLSAKQLEFFRSEILSTYGYEYLFTLGNMEKLGLIRKQEGKAAFPVLRKALRLIVEDVHEHEPNDIAYVYSGYAPLSIRLIEMRDQWRQMDDVLRLLPGPTIEQEQELPHAVKEALNGAGNRSKVTLVFFIGGITFTEIAALRYLNQTDENTEYIIATTKLINGDTLLSTFLSVFGVD